MSETLLLFIEEFSNNSLYYFILIYIFCSMLFIYSSIALLITKGSLCSIPPSFTNYKISEESNFKFYYFLSISLFFKVFYLSDDSCINVLLNFFSVFCAKGLEGLWLYFKVSCGGFIFKAFLCSCLTL